MGDLSTSSTIILSHFRYLLVALCAVKPGVTENQKKNWKSGQDQVLESPIHIQLFRLRIKNPERLLFMQNKQYCMINELNKYALDVTEAVWLTILTCEKRIIIYEIDKIYENTIPLMMFPILWMENMGSINNWN